MAMTEQYRKWIQELLTRYAALWNGVEGLESQVLFDRVHDRYQWLRMGWKGSERVFNCVMYFDIRDGKVWLQQNWTDRDPAAELVEMGVPREDIVLGLQPPEVRPYTDYGVA
ncbi:MAG: XisI protein [Alkalinema sp. RU_4_3]|nr:XisI protein [Alkalinema sp. RU_4_3]